jgi:hypothetical protein
MRWSVPGPIEILTDSQYTKGVLSLGWKIKANRELIEYIKACPLLDRAVC